MTTYFTPHVATGRMPLACNLPLSLLALADMMTLTRKYAQFLNEPPEQNRWFVIRGKEALPPQSFHEVLSRLARGEGPLSILRETEAEQEPAPWYTLEFEASVSNRATALAVIAGFWVVVLFLGWVVMAVLAPIGHSVLWDSAYFVAALGLVGWLCLPGRGGTR